MTGRDTGMPLDFDALYRGESPGDGIPPMTTAPWDTKAHVTGPDISPTALITAAVHRATRAGATLLLSCFSPENEPPAPDRPRPTVSEATLRAVLGDAGWQIVSLQPAAVHREGWGGEMNFWYVHAQRIG